MGQRRISVEAIRKLLAQGHGVAQAAKILGASYQGVYAHVRKEKIPYTFDSGRNRVVIPDLRQLVEAGWKTGDIARKYNLHYKLVWWWIRKLKIPYDIARHGRYNGAWTGGRRVHGNYVYLWCPDHPFATQAGCVFEHRLVMELKLGRYLHPDEVVHHKKGYGNDPDNLELFETNAAHLAATLKGKIPKWTPAGRRRILAAVRLPRGPRKKPTRAKSEKNASP